jgi:hypothetical protein
MSSNVEDKFVSTNRSFFPYILKKYEEENESAVLSLMDIYVTVCGVTDES